MPPTRPLPSQPATEGSWKPGQSGNPGGRPKGYVPFAPLLRRELAKVDRRNRSNLEKLAEKVVALALKGDMDAIRWIADRTDGKVSQQVNVTSEQTVHVVPWLPYVQDAAEAALNGHTVDVPQLETEGGEKDADDGD